MSTRITTLLICSLLWLHPAVAGAAEVGGAAVGGGAALTGVGVLMFPVSAVLEQGEGDWDGAVLLRLAAAPMIAAGLPMLIAGAAIQGTADGVVTDPTLQRVWAQYIVARTVVVPALIFGQAFGAIALAAVVGSNSQSGGYYDGPGYLGWPSVVAPVAGFGVQATGYALVATGVRNRRVLDDRGYEGVDEPGDLLKAAGVAGLATGLSLFGVAASIRVMSWSSGASPAAVSVMVVGGIDAIVATALLVLAHQEQKRYPVAPLARSSSSPRVQLCGIAPFVDPVRETAGIGAAFRF